jgi:hypothetical protein
MALQRQTTLLMPSIFKQKILQFLILKGKKCEKKFTPVG